MGYLGELPSSNRPLVPNMIRIALLALLAIDVAIADLGTIQRISTLTSICNDCDMTLFGTINVKVCGGGGGVGGYEPCCSVVNIANFDSGLFQQGQLDEFTGKALETCDNFSLSQLNNPSDLLICRSVGRTHDTSRPTRHAR